MTYLIEKGVELPSHRGKGIASDAIDAAKDMVVGDCILVPYNREIAYTSPDV